ncbi:ATP-binding protein, partial [Nonomuraea sp. NPDC005983]|uniref:ATP-binding protein n=1 Tax=Nonomuraea sp. NPDC005983 TaxID=3155595 RepID=UPI0033A001A1
MHLGRTTELALLRAELHASDAGPARRVLVEGPEGIGKTALIRQAFDTEQPLRLLSASGEEAERGLRFGVMRQLAPDATGDDPYTVGQSVCDAIGRLQAEGPVVVVVDDAQWADRLSLRALTYVLRRLRGGRVLVVVACRDVADPWLPDGLRRLLTGDGALRTPLTGLTTPELAGLAEQAGLPARAGQVDASGAAGQVDGAGRAEAFAPVGPLDGGGPVGGLGRQALSERAVARLRAHTLGNPLHALALLATVPPHRLADPAAPLPAPDTYARPFARRLEACGPSARALVAACAVLGGRTTLHLAATVAASAAATAAATVAATVAASAMPAPSRPTARPAGARAVVRAAGVAWAGVPAGALDALEEAVTAGVLEESPGRVIGFTEPLARAAAYGRLGAGARARLHLAAAGVVEDAGQALRHRAAAASGPDEALAEELARYAAKAAQHGLWEEATAHLEVAAGLAESAARRDELQTAVLEHVLMGGDVGRAAELAAVRNADPRPVRRYVLGRLALASGRLEEAAGLLASAWRDREPGFAADVAEQLAWLHLVTADREGAATWALAAIEEPIQGVAARPYDVLVLSSPDAERRREEPEGGVAAAVRRLREDDAAGARRLLAGTVAALAGS